MGQIKVMTKIAILSSSHMVLKIIRTMLSGFAELFAFKKSDLFIEFVNNIKPDFIIIDRTVGNESAKEIILQIKDLPPSILLVSGKYNKETDGENFSFVLRKPFKKEELREVISFLLFSEKFKEKSDISVLVIDDSHISRDILKSKIFPMGFKVHEAHGAIQALDILNNPETIPSVIVTDYEMPEMTGTDLVKYIREQEILKDIPVIMVSASNNVEIRKQAFLAGINEFLPKPFDDKHLQDTINKFVEKKSSDFANYSIIIIDDSPSRRKAMSSVLKSIGFKVITTGKSNRFIELIEDNKFDLCLVDFILEDTTGIELIKFLRNKMKTEFPIIIYTANDNFVTKKKLNEIYNAGANDYLVAPFEYEELIFKVKTWINYNKLLQEYKAKEKMLTESMTYDLLTGVLNRFNIFKRGEEYFSLCKRKELPLSILYMDIDHFKKINDTYGHDFGDIVLKKFAETINDNIREEDVFGRIGGEEFLAVLPFTDKDEAFTVAEKLRKLVSEMKFENLDDLSITVSAGLAFFGNNTDIDTFDQLITMADNLLYRAKKSGRNKVVYEKNSIKPETTVA